VPAKRNRTESGRFFGEDQEGELEGFGEPTFRVPGGHIHVALDTSACRP
jgi:hypothetical protein